MNRLGRFFILAGLIVITTVHADSISHTHVVQQSQNTPMSSGGLKKSTVIATANFDALPENKQKSMAGIFSLKPKEYRQFLHYMNDTMDGYEYDQHINPNLVLAMHAQDHDDYIRYLKNVARADHDALARLLKVTVDYPKVMKSLYPAEKPMMTPAMQASMNNHLQAGDVIQLFCEPQSAVCSNILSVIKAPILHTEGVRLDLFFVGNVKKADIIHFAKSNTISAQQVDAHKITLNFGNSVFHTLEKEQSSKLPLPYLLVRRGGKSVPVNLGGQHA